MCYIGTIPPNFTLITDLFINNNLKVRFISHLYGRCSIHNKTDRYWTLRGRNWTWAVGNGEELVGHGTTENGVSLEDTVFAKLKTVPPQDL